MVQVLNPNVKPRGPSFSEQIGLNEMARNAGTNFGSGFASVGKEKQIDAKIQELTGKDVSGLPLESKMKLLEMNEHFNNQKSLQNDKFSQEKELQGLKSQEKTFENNQKLQEKIAPFQAGLQTIEQMRNLRQKGNIGFGSKVSGIWDPETRKNRAEYETLGNSLISLASTIPIRNKAEFETLTGKLNDPSLTLSEIDGVLDAMERIITQNMQSQQSDSSLPSMNKNQRPPLSQFQL